MERVLKVLYKRRKMFLGLISISIFLTAWELAVDIFKLIDPLFISSPWLVFKAGIELIVTGEIWMNLRVSASEFLVGFFLAVVVGIPIGILIGWYETINSLLNPFISALYATPRVAFLPLIVIWLGIGIWSKVAVIFLGAVLPIIVNTAVGIETTDKALLKAARSFGANDAQIFKTIALPGAIPVILTGIRLGLGRALLGVVVGELYAANAGIGYLITVAGATFQTSKVLFSVFIITGAGIIFIEMSRYFEKKFDKWRE